MFKTMADALCGDCNRTAAQTPINHSEYNVSGEPEVETSTAAHAVSENGTIQ